MQNSDPSGVSSIGFDGESELESNSTMTYSGAGAAFPAE
jgi:hypothetical protein